MSKAKPTDNSLSRREFIAKAIKWSAALTSLGIISQTLPGCAYTNELLSSDVSTSSTTSTTTTTLPQGYFYAGGYYS